MDKYEKVLDIIAHHENYTDQQLADLLADDETRKIYNLLCGARSVLESTRCMSDEDVAREWERFRESNNPPLIAIPARRRSRLRIWLGSRAAVITAVMVTSLGSVAVGIGLNMSGRFNDESRTESETHGSNMEMPTAMANADNDSLVKIQESILFENATLEAILREVGARYGVSVKFNDDTARKLRLYYRLDTSMSLEEIISHLNNFDRIDLSLDGKTLNVD